MAGFISVIDIVQRSFEIATGAPLDENAAILSDLTKIAEAGTPEVLLIPPAPAGAEPTSAPPEISLPPIVPTAAAPVTSASEVAAQFGIGAALNVTAPPIEATPPLAPAPALVAAAPTIASAPAAPTPALAAAAPTELAAPTPEVPLPIPEPLPIQEIDAMLRLLLLEGEPDAQTQRAQRLSALAGLAANDTRPPAPITPTLSPPTPAVTVEPLDAALASKTHGLRVTIRHAPTGTAGGAKTSAAGTPTLERTLGIGSLFDIES